MSTTTNFKRIALVAVAALGLGVLSSAPSQAAINADTVTLSSTTAAQSTAETYTASAAVVTVSFFGAPGDSMSVTAALTSAPAGNTALPTLQLIETSNAMVETATATGLRLAIGDTRQANAPASVKTELGTVVTTAKFAVYLTQGNAVTAPTTVGAYGVRITPATVGASGALQGSAAVNLTITVSAAPSLATAAAAGTSVVQIQATSATGYVAATDSTVAAPKTASTSVSSGFLYILIKNASGGTAAAESVTVTTDRGSLGFTHTAQSGRSLNVKALGTAPSYVYLFADGNAGKANITVSSASGVLLSTKSATFADTATKFGTPAIPATSPQAISPSGTTIVAVDATDAAGNSNSAATVYAFSSNTSVITVPASAITYSSSTSPFPVTVTGVAAGEATVTFGNAATLAASTFTSAPITVRVGTNTVSGVRVAFDKQAYAPGEMATISVTALDSTGKAITGGGNKDAIFAAGGITSSLQLGNGSDTLTPTTLNISALTGAKAYTVYMPYTGGTVKLTWTGGTGLAAANQVAGTTSATVSDSGAAALAAVTALATTVASLRTLIVTLTNLVLKIQKKVRA
jgi:trimeric autotransporter adhesin